MRPLMTLEAAHVIVDPNSMVRRDPSLTVARFADADRVPRVGEVVVARQPDEDGSDFVGSARVVEINPEHGLIYLRVDWSSFRDVPAMTTDRPATIGALVWGLLTEGNGPSWNAQGVRLAAAR